MGVKNPRALTGSIQPVGGDKDSLFVTCASYEERCVHAPRRLESSYLVESSIICRAVEYKDKGDSGRYYAEISRSLRSHSFREPIEHQFAIERPVEFLKKLDMLVNRCHSVAPFNSVTLDITTFPRRELLVLLRYLDTRPNRGPIRLLYSEPERYATEEANDDDGWLTRGVRSVISVPGFSGIQLPHLSKLLIVIMGHEGERTHITLRRHQPDRVVFLRQGDGQFRPGLKDIAERQNQNLMSEFAGQCFWDRSVPARGVIETDREIRRVFKKYRYAHNLFVAPNGTKLQLLGCYLACKDLNEM